MSRLSIVVIFHNMTREAARTLYTLSPAYQQGVSADDYDVLAIDNGSEHNLDAFDVRSYGPNFSYQFFTTTSVSPAAAINHGIKQASAAHVAVIVDGARMVTPGIVRQTLDAIGECANPMVGALAWHLGPDLQYKSINQGYCQEVEDQLLSTVDWHRNGYELFNISTITSPSSGGFFGPIPDELSWLTMPRAAFLEIGGYNEKFQSPGGGFVNQDILTRILDRADITPIIILGEGCFHQFHGGVATNRKIGAGPMPVFRAEYREITGKPFKKGEAVMPLTYGQLSREALPFAQPRSRPADA